MSGQLTDHNVRAFLLRYMVLLLLAGNDPFGELGDFLADFSPSSRDTLLWALATWSKLEGLDRPALIRVFEQSRPSRPVPVTK